MDSLVEIVKIIFVGYVVLTIIALVLSRYAMPSANDSSKYRLFDSSGNPTGREL